MDPVVYTLKTPLETRSKETGEVLERISELRLRPLLAGDLVEAIDAGKGGTAQASVIRMLACRSAGLTREQFDRLSIEDGIGLMEAVAPFIPAGLTTGPTGSA